MMTMAGYRQFRRLIAEGDALRAEMGAPRLSFVRCDGDTLRFRILSRVPFTAAWFVRHLRDLKIAMECHLDALAGSSDMGGER